MTKLIGALVDVRHLRSRPS